MTAVFWFGVALLAYAYAGYPLSLALLGAFARPRRRLAGGDDLPSLTLVISVYNEEACLRQKLENSLALDYPADRIRRVVVSDGSTDRSEAIVREFDPRGVELRAFAGRQGKVACLNRVIPDLTSDLVVMSDANSMYAPDSLKRLVAHFADRRVGCVCGRLRYDNPGGDAAGESERVYWGYEGLIKRLESRLGSLLGANGSIYAYRRPLFRTVDPLMFCDDVIPIRIAIQGWEVLYEPAASCSEEAPPEAVEMRRRRRHASFGLRSMRRMMRESLAAGRLLIVYQCLCHRVLRWLGGLALLGILVSTPFLAPPLRVWATAGQGALYGAAVLGLLASRARLKIPAAYHAYYLLAIHAAGLTGLFNFVLGADAPHWEPRQ